MKISNGRHNILYRDTKNGKIAGVCAGIADYFSWDVTVVRIVTVVAAISFTVVTLALYIAAALFLDPKPQDLYEDPEEEEYWRRYRRSPRNTMSEARRRFRRLDKKLRKLEAYVTSRKFELDREFEKIDDRKRT